MSCSKVIINLWPQVVYTMINEAAHLSPLISVCVLSVSFTYGIYFSGVLHVVQIFVPIHITCPCLHWTLVVVDVEANTFDYYDSALGLEKKPRVAQERRMDYMATVRRYDSKQPWNLSQLVTPPAAPPLSHCLGLNVLCMVMMCCSYLEQDHLAKTKTPIDLSGWERIVHADTPQQAKGTLDCGIFLCAFVYLLSEGLNISLVRTFSPSRLAQHDCLMAYSMCAPLSKPLP